MCDLNLSIKFGVKIFVRKLVKFYTFQIFKFATLALKNNTDLAKAVINVNKALDQVWFGDKFNPKFF